MMPFYIIQKEIRTRGEAVNSRKLDSDEWAAWSTVPRRSYRALVKMSMPGGYRIDAAWSAGFIRCSRSEEKYQEIEISLGHSIEEGPTC